MKKSILVELKPNDKFYGREWEKDGVKGKFTHKEKGKALYRLFVTDGDVYIKPFVSEALMEDSEFDYRDHIIDKLKQFKAQGVIMNLFDEILEIYHSKHEPEGWVIGKHIYEQLRQESKKFAYWHKDDEAPRSLYGLPYFIDTENPERIELIA